MRDKREAAMVVEKQLVDARDAYIRREIQKRQVPHVDKVLSIGKPEDQK